MKTKIRYYKWLMLLVLFAGSVGAWAQTSTSLTQTVCPGSQPYYVVPGNASNTALWAISPAGPAITPGADQWHISVNWPNPLIPTIYTLTLTESSANGCDSLVSVVVTVNPQPVAPTASDQIVCSDGSTTQTLTATATAPAGSTVVWYAAAIGGTAIATPTQVGVGTGTYYAESVASTGTCPSLTRTAVTLTINAAPAAPTASDQIVCSDGSTTQTLTATATAPAGSTVVWYAAAIGGTAIPTPTQVGVGTGTYYAESVASTGTCPSLTRTAVTLTINAAPAAPTASDQIVCSDGSTTQTLTATATAPAGSTVVWYAAAIGGTAIPTPTQVGVGTGTYYAESVASTGTCPSLTRTAVTLTINAAPAAPTASDQIVCSDGSTTQTLTATATAPAGSTVVWYAAAIGGTAIPTPTQVGVGTGTYYAESVASTGTCPSLTRTAVTLTINAAPAAPTASDQIVCSDGSTTQTLTATATAPAGSTVVWYAAAIGGTAIPTPTQVGVGTGTYYAESVASTGTCPSLTRTAVTLTINAAPAAPTASDQIVCSDGSTTQTLTATATAPAGSTVVWYAAATGGTAIATPTQVGVGTGTYYAESVASTGTCPSLTRTAVTLTINAAPAAPTASDQIVCSDGSTTQTLTATATAPAGSTVVWYAAAIGGTAIPTPTQVGVGTGTYYAESVASTGTCPSLTRTAVTLTINAAPAAPTASDQIVCSDGSTTQTLTATATAPAGSTVVWYAAAIGGTAIPTPTQVGVGTGTYYAESVASTGTCPSLTRTAVTLTINAAPAAPTASDQIVCSDGSTTQTLTATATAPAGSTVVWYAAAIGGTAIPTPTQVGVGTGTYYAESVASTGTCPSLTRTAVTLTINGLPNASISYDNASYCTTPAGTGSTTVTITGQTGGAFTYSPSGLVIDPITGTINLGTSSPGTYTVTYTFTNGTCPNSTSTTVIINASPATSPIYHN